MEAQNSEPRNPSVTPIRLDLINKKGEVLHTSEYVKEKIVIGRILSADLRIDDARVSRIHALIEVRGDTVTITDLASSHGTFVNGSKIVEHKIKWGDVIKVGYIEMKVLKGSGKVTSNQPVLTGHDGSSESDETLVNIDRSHMDDDDRRQEDRRHKDAFPTEGRLDDRRAGDRRIDQRKGERRKVKGSPPEGMAERRSGKDRRADRTTDRRVGDRRRGDRRVFDITSLERRIEDRRARKSDDDLLPQELERAFEAPGHARELEVTAMWGDHILDVSNYADPCVLNIGESPRNDYIIPSVGIPDEFPLISIEEDGTAYLAFTDEMQGTIRARDKMYQISDLKEEKFIRKSGDYFVLPMKQDDFAKLAIGTVNFFVLYVRPAPRIKPPPFFENDALMIRTAVGSILLFLMLMIGLSFVEKPKPVTIEQIPERFQKIVIRKKPEIAKVGIQAKDEQSKQGGSVAGEGGPAIGNEGEAGRKDLPKKAEKAQTIMPKSKPKDKPAAPQAKPALTERQRKVVDENKAKSVGLLKAFSKGGVSKDLQAVLDRGDGPEGPGGFDDFGKAVAGFRGKSIEETGGAGGKGLKGVDVGGGGKTIGIDGPSTKGLGRGYHGDGIGEGISGPGRFGIKGEHAISIITENVQVLSGLSKDLINAVVQRHRSEIRGCYDTALQRNPGLKGKVVLAFNIDPNGVVQFAKTKESTIGDAGLERCIESRIKTWQFPKPEAPVVTEVSAYPFYLNPAN